MVDSVAYYHRAYAPHTIMNPIRPDRFASIARRHLPASGATVLDIGSGKGHASLILTETCGARCVQIDSSPQWTAQAADLFRSHGREAHTQILTMDASRYEAPDEAFDAIVCLGTAPIYGGLEEAIDALAHALRPDGVFIIGEATSDLPLPRKYRAYVDKQNWAILSADALLDIIDGAYFELLECHRSSAEEWDEYMSLQWSAIAAHARSNPEDREAEEFATWAREEQEVYLAYQRHFLDWNVAVLRPRR
jgi:cyclopropane fatty-acyl-phospholipid synthase-like methyltransferase